MEPRQRASGEQLDMPLEYMERHGDLANPQMDAQGRRNSSRGGVVKPDDMWKKVWADWKTKTKKKHLDIKYHASGTGGGPSSRCCLTAIEERVVAVLGVSAVPGQLSLPERGFNTAPPPVLEYAFDVGNVIVEVPFSPDSPAHPAPPSSPLPLCSSSPVPPPPFSQLSPPHPSPPAPSYLLPPPPSFLPLSSPQRRQRTPARRQSRSPRRDAEPRRNRGLTSFERMVQVFGSIEQSRLEVERRRLELEVEREKRRLELEVEREKRRLELEVEREKRRLELEVEREKRRLELEVEREKRRLELEDEREKRRLRLEERRLAFEERRERRLHERDVLYTGFMQHLLNNNERFLGSSLPLSPPHSPAPYN